MRRLEARAHDSLPPERLFSFFEELSSKILFLRLEDKINSALKVLGVRLMTALHKCSEEDHSFFSPTDGGEPGASSL